MKWTKEKLELFCALKEQGMTLKDIAAELGCSYSAANSKSKRLKDSEKAKPKPKPAPAAPVVPTATVTEISEVTETPTATLDALTNTPTATPDTPTATLDAPIRAKILDTAKSIITGEREKQYGHPEDNFKTIARLWEAYLSERCVGSDGITINPEDVAIMMTFLKIARIMSGNYKEDSFVDVCGYLALAGEMMK